jgi:hypothetical protein
MKFEETYAESNLQMELQKNWIRKTIFLLIWDLPANRFSLQ